MVLGLSLPGEYGGVDNSLAEFVALHEELGRFTGHLSSDHSGLEHESRVDQLVRRGRMCKTPGEFQAWLRAINAWASEAETNRWMCEATGVG